MEIRGKIRRVAILLLLSAVYIQTLFSAITATYVPYSNLLLKRGNEISTPNTPAGTFPNDKLVVHLGTISITKGANDKYYRPLLENYFSESDIYLIGPIVGSSTKRSLFQVYAKNSMQSQPNKIKLSDLTTPLYDWSSSEITQSPFIVDLFLVSSNDASLFYENENYTIQGGLLGAFNILVSRESNLKDSSLQYISINNQLIPEDGAPPVDPIAIPEVGTGVAITNIAVGSETVTFNVNVRENSPINLSQACSNTGVKVATLELVVNGSPGHNYNFQIKFSNPLNSPTFSLRVADNPSGYAIPYKLKFGDSVRVTGGEVINWTGLNNGYNSKELRAYGISETVVGNAHYGTFEDSIIIEISSSN